MLGRVEFPYPVVPVVRHHHERWDGKGYPDGLAGEEIPLTARILSVVDCFDAVREDRPYRKGMTRAEAIDYIMSGSGTQYDLHVVGTFITHLPEFEAEIMASRNQPLPTYGIEAPEVLSDAASQVHPAAGLAITSAEDENRIRLSDEELGTLYELSQAAAMSRSTEELAVIVSDKLKLIVPFETCVFTMLDPGSGDSVVLHAAGKHAEAFKRRNVPLGEGVTGWVLANQKPYCNADPRLDLPASLLGETDAFRTLVAYPIILDSVLLGAVTLYSSTLTEYIAQHQRLLAEVVTIVAGQLSTTPSFRI